MVNQKAEDEIKEKEGRVKFDRPAEILLFLCLLAAEIIIQILVGVHADVNN